MTGLNTQTVRLAREIQGDSIVDGEGLRTVIWFQGCPHQCPNCHNPASHDFNGGKVIEIKTLLASLGELNFQDGITFSGGEPFAQIEALVEIAKEAKRLELNIWAYTGYEFEELLRMGNKKPQIIEALKLIDVLVDGRFILAEKSLNLKFRGSKNQRIINVPKSLNSGKTVLIQKYRKEKETISYYKKEFV